jgi:predicted transcriptional regulator
MSDTTKTTVYLDADVYRRLKALAAKGGRSTAELVREAVAVYAEQHTRGATARSVGAGHSGRADLSERAENLLKGMGRPR